MNNCVNVVMVIGGGGDFCRFQVLLKTPGLGLAFKILHTSLLAASFKRCISGEAINKLAIFIVCLSLGGVVVTKLSSIRCHNCKTGQL